MASTLNSVALRAKNRLIALHAWTRRVERAHEESVLSYDQYTRAIDWCYDQAATASRQLCAFASKVQLILLIPSHVQRAIQPELHRSYAKVSRIDLVPSIQASGLYYGFQS